MASRASLPEMGASGTSELIRVRRIATGILLVLMAILVATHFVEDLGPGVLLIRSMAEAGMVGGIADWFAVEALFRHPLGIPIPHTALLPKNQQRAARNVGRFFHDNFLQPDQVRERLAEIHPARRAAEWLSDRDHAALIGKHLTGALGYVLHRKVPKKLMARIRSEMRALVSSNAANQALADTIAPLVKEGLSDEIVSDLLLRMRDAIDENRDKVIGIVQKRSRWWIASAVDRRIATTIVDGVLSVMDDLTDEGSPLRANFETGFGRMIDEMARSSGATSNTKSSHRFYETIAACENSEGCRVSLREKRVARDGALAKAIEKGRDQFLASGGFDAMAATLGSAVHTRLINELSDHPDRVSGLLAEIIRKFALELLEDEAALADFEIRLGQAAEQIVTELRVPLSGYVTDVIASWDTQVFSERFENEIGPDLQYIRINGAVLGSLIGGLLFAAETVLG